MFRGQDLEREYQRIRQTIDHMVLSQYTELNTMAFTIILISLSILMVTLTVIFDNRVPEALSEKYKLGGLVDGSFIGERAYRNLKELSDIGPKYVGSHENEYLTVNYLREKIDKLRLQMPTTWNEIQLDVQIVSGSFNIVSTDETFRRETAYQYIQNVVAKLRSKNNVNESILINCHFDSVFTSPGTSDDGLNCAVMLEVLRVLSKVNYPLKKNLVFLFNGAEEDGVSGSHGFITKHKWADEIISFINLDACGAGGRQILFQTGPRAKVLAQIYAHSVPYPSSKVIGEELFQSGAMPSDSDFKIFRDYGGLHGLDLAHVKNGYVYHTRSDNITMVSENVVQLTGDNLLALVKAFVDYDNLQEAIYESNDRAVYFDVFGKFVICYSSTAASLINLIVAFISLYSAMSLLYSVFRGKPVKMILDHVLIDLAFFVSGILAVTLVLYLLAALLKISDLTMLWYSNRWFVLSFYAAPVLLVMFMVVRMRETFIYTLLNGEQEAKVFIFIIQIIITIIFLFGTASGIRSSFILAIGLIGVSISHYFVDKTRLRLEIVEHKFLTYTLVNFIPALYCAYVFIPSFEVIIPMLGRNGADYDSETTIWIATEIAVLITFAYFIPLVLLVKEFWTMQYVFFIVYLLQVFYVLSSALTPFSESAPQRFVALHVDRKLTNFDNAVPKNETSGYLIMPNDMLGGENILKLFEIEGFKQLGNIEDTCSKELFCGMPSLYAKRINSGHLSFWAPKEKPVIGVNKSISHRIYDEGYDLRTYQIALEGSKFMDVVILPLNNATLSKWSFNPTTPGNELKWNNQPAYLIRLHEGSVNINDIWSFNLTFDLGEMRLQSEPVFKLAWSVFHPSNKADHFTPQFKEFVDEFPEWTRVVPMVVEYEEYNFYKTHH